MLLQVVTQLVSCFSRSADSESRVPALLEVMADTMTPQIARPGKDIYWHGTVGSFRDDGFPELFPDFISFYVVGRPGRDCEVGPRLSLIPV